MTGVHVTELHTQDGYDWPNGCGDERWPAHTITAAKRERETRDRCLRQLTAQVLDAREKWPFASTHSVCSRKPGRVVQHKVPADVPAESVRAWIERDLGWA